MKLTDFIRAYLMSRVKTRKNFRDLKQFKQQRHKPKKGKGSWKRVKKGDMAKMIEKISGLKVKQYEWECD